ncbi:MAG: hypothetical protein QW153_03750 [Candidatus Bilamarchaeaceae archaeon]
MEILRLKNTSELLLHKSKKLVAIVEDLVYDEGVLRVIGEKKSLIVFVALDSLLSTKGIARSRLLYRMRNFLNLCVRFGVLFVIGFEKDAENGAFLTREKDEVIALGELLGLNRGQAKMAVARFEDLFIKK